MTTPDFAALVARLNLCGKGERLAVPELCAEAAAALVQLKASAAALMADAERYRWIRKFGEDGTPHIAVEDYLPAPSKDHFKIRWLYEEDADAAIDAAKGRK